MARSDPAEILSAFDVCAVQELCEDLAPLEHVMRLLDPAYEFIITDVTEGPGGNKERLGFIYDSKKVDFKGVAGEIVLPNRDLVVDGERLRQFARTPFSCVFQASWFRFTFSTVHIYCGAPGEKSSKYKRRVQEILRVAKFLSKRADRSSDSQILVGDFNIEDYEAKTFDALADQGFEMHRNKQGSNADQTKFYDQISFKAQEGRIQFAEPQGEIGDHGTFNLFERLYNREAFEQHRPAVEASIQRRLKRLAADIRRFERSRDRAKTKTTVQRRQADIAKARTKIDTWEARLADEDELFDCYWEWRTFQLSDHLPLWVNLRIDFADAYLDRIQRQSRERTAGTLLPN